MEMSFYILLSIVILFGSMQSILGIGLLLFGTPVLLILDFNYIEVLWILLPTSCSLSLYQIFENYKLVQFRKEVFMYTLPTLILSLLILLSFDYFFDVKKIVGVFLILIAILRLSHFSKIWVETVILKSKNFIYFLIGLMHGFSNLGGAPLTILISSLYQDDKKISTNIAFVYFILALSQLIILYTNESDFFDLTYLVFIPIVILNHILLNKFFSIKFNNSSFKIILNMAIFLFGFACLF
tara:strand:- start:123 stop:842 length:720 start_codon:yes stop_codon:yes gene_type:complete